MYYMTGHLFEAILLNLKRAPKYAKLSGGKSIPISIMLVLSELLSLVTSVIMDTRAKYWQKRGVPVFVYEFIPMSEAPAFNNSRRPLNLQSLPQYNIGKDELKRLIKKKDLGGLSKALEKRLKDLDTFLGVYCMTRHTFESFLRSVNLAQKHIERAKVLGVKSPESFCVQNLNAHLLAMDFCLLLDKAAFSVQKEGVAIIRNDVPLIPPMPKSY